MYRGPGLSFEIIKSVKFLRQKLFFANLSRNRFKKVFEAMRCSPFFPLYFYICKIKRIILVIQDVNHRKIHTNADIQPVKSELNINNRI